MFKFLGAFIILLSFFSNNSVHSQENDPCVTNDKKLTKILATAMAEDNFGDKTEKFSEAIQKFPDNAETYFLYARACEQEGARLAKDVKTKNQGEALQQKSVYFYQASIKKCPNFHADCYYKIGITLLSNGDLKNALPYLKKFVDFPEDNYSVLPQDFIQKRAELNAIIEDIEFEKNLRENPVPFSPSKVLNVSSGLDEYFPMISPDNDFIFFTRKVDNTNLGNIANLIEEEFTLASRLNEGQNTFTYGERLPDPFNDGSFYNYGTATLSVDNKEMIICACKKEIVYNQDYLNCDLYSTKFKRSGKGGNDFEWTPLVNMGPKINTKDGWEAQPSLSADGKLLFFTSFRKGSRDNDIYLSERQADGSWSVAKPFDVVNTAGKDKSPFFHQDGETLYFVSSCSNSRKGLGGLDIFYIRRENNGWTKPENIGYPINSVQDELGLFVSTNGKVAYYSSDKDGDWNIYAFDLYEKARPQEVVILKGALIDDSGNPISDAKIEVSYNESGETQTFDVNGDDGKYAAVVKVSNPQDVTISVSKEGLAYNAKVVEKEIFENRKSSNIQIGNIKTDSIKPGQAYQLDEIYFATDSWELNKRSILLLNGFSSYLKKNPILKISVNGHTDDIGDDEKNRILSQKRAESVKSYLVEKGVSDEQIEAMGFGETKPRVPNTNDKNRSKNRRTEFQILD
jgi:outer membrane protein OmpA-like peptidoglycan-associated protein/tetratricopeptide (TPR) repeat protein